MGLGDVPRVPRSRSTSCRSRSTCGRSFRSARCSSGCWATSAPRQARCRPTPSTPRCAACCTRRWTPAPAAGRRNGSSPAAASPCSATTTASPMVSDVMHDETCIELAEVLAERNEGFIQMTLGKADGTTMDHLEKLAAVERPAAAVERRARRSTATPEHSSQPARVAPPLSRARHPRLRTGPDDRRRIHVLVRRVEPLRRSRRLARRHDRHRRRTARQALRSVAPPGAARRIVRGSRSGPIESIVVAETFCDETKRFVNETIGDIAAGARQASRRRVARHRRRRRPARRRSSRCPPMPASRAFAT